MLGGDLLSSEAVGAVAVSRPRRAHLAVVAPSLTPGRDELERQVLRHVGPDGHVGLALDGQRGVGNGLPILLHDAVLHVSQLAEGGHDVGQENGVEPHLLTDGLERLREEVAADAGVPLHHGTQEDVGDDVQEENVLLAAPDDLFILR